MSEVYIPHEFRKENRERCIDLYDDYSSLSADDALQQEKLMIDWITSMCTGKVQYNGDMVFFFELEDDFINFKMRW